MRPALCCIISIAIVSILLVSIVIFKTQSVIDRTQ